MKTIETLKNVRVVRLLENIVSALTKENESYIFENKFELFKDNVFDLIKYNKLTILQYKNGEDLITQIDSKETIHQGTFYTNTISCSPPFFYLLSVQNENQILTRIDAEGKLKNLPLNYYGKFYKELCFTRSKNQITLFDTNKMESVFSIDLADFEEMQSETIESTVNVYPFLDNKNLYVPFKSGYLLVLDIKAGNKLWGNAYQRSGTYASYNGILFKNDGLSIQKIDAQSGQLLQTKEFAADSRISKFYSTGPTWIFDDMIFMISVSDGEICVLNANDLSVIDYGKIESASGIPNSKDSLIYIDNKIYVLDIEGTLHVLEME